MITTIITSLVAAMAVPRVLSQFNVPASYHHILQLLTVGLLLEYATDLPQIGVPWAGAKTYGQLTAVLPTLRIDHSTGGLIYPSELFKQVVEWANRVGIDKATPLYFLGGPRVLETPYETWASRELPEIQMLRKYLAAQELWPYALLAVVIAYVSTQSISLSRWSFTLYSINFAGAAVNAYFIFNDGSFVERRQYFQPWPRFFMFIASVAIFAENSWLHRFRAENKRAKTLASVNQALMQDVGRLAAVQGAQATISEDAQLFNKFKTRLAQSRRNALASAREEKSHFTANPEDYVHDAEHNGVSQFMIAGENYSHTRSLVQF